MGCKIERIPEGYVGCTLTCAPYVVLARKVVPAGEKPDVLESSEKLGYFLKFCSQAEVF